MIKTLHAFAFALKALFAQAASTPAVTDLTADSLDAFVSAHAVTMVEFYAPWCEVCKEVEPIYEAAAAELDPSVDVKFARVDCVADEALCEQYEVMIYPTLRLFQGIDKHDAYHGERTVSEMISHAMKRLPAPVTVLTSSSIDQFQPSDENVVIGYWPTGDQVANETFTKIAEEYLDYYRFGATNDPEVARRADLNAPGIVLRKPYDEHVMQYTGPFDEDEVIDFFVLNSIPLIGEYTRKWSWTYFGNGSIPVVGIFAASAAQRAEIADQLRPLAKELRASVRFAAIDASTYDNVAKKFRIADQNIPTLAIVDLENQAYHTPKDFSITEESVRQFVQNFLSGQLKQYVEPEVVSDVDEKAVVVIEESNFSDIVMNDQLDVLLEFYAPWCGHCKKLIPTYAQLATSLAASDPNIRIAKVDATKNNIPGFPIKSYPTIMYFPAKSKDAPVTFSGDRTVEDFTKFVREFSSSSISEGSEKRANVTSTLVSGIVESIKSTLGLGEVVAEKMEL